jgi:hypothetical protein
VNAVDPQDVVGVGDQRRAEQPLQAAGDITRVVRGAEEDEIRLVPPRELGEGVGRRLARIVRVRVVLVGVDRSCAVLAEDARGVPRAAPQRDRGDVRVERPRLRQQLERRRIDPVRPHLRVDPDARH